MNENEFDFNWNYVKKGAPFVTISKLGLAFNQISIEFLGTPENIKIGYDSKKKVIGVMPAELNDSSDTFIFKERINVNSGWVRIGCKDFIRYISKETGIDYENDTQKLIPELLNDNKLLFIQLTKTTPEKE